MYSINTLISSLLDHKTYRNVCDKCYDDETYMGRMYYRDSVNESMIIALIKKCYFRYKLQYVLLEILFYINEESITDNVIRFCLNYRGKFRKSLLVQLSHLWLKEYQFELIVKKYAIPEAYCKLLLLKICNLEDSDDDIVKFIGLNRKYLKNLQVSHDYFKDKPISKQRIDLIKNLGVDNLNI